MKTLLVALPLVTLAVGVSLQVWRCHFPRWAALVADLLPAAWMFGFSLLDLYAVRWLTPVNAHRMFPANALATAGLMALVVALLPRKVRYPGAGAVAFALAFLSFADILYDRYFGSVLPIVAAGSAVHLWDVRDSIVALVEKRDAWMLCFFGSALAVMALWRSPLLPRTPRPFVRALAFALPVLAIAAPSVSWTYLDVTSWLTSKFAREVLNRHDNLEQSGIIGAHIREATLAIKQTLEHRELTDEELEETRRYFAERKQAHDPGDALFGVARGKSVLVLQVEALEEWVLDAKVNGEEITPFLNRLKRESLYYPNLLDQTGSSSTSDCEYLVLNSQHPLENGSVAFRRESNRFQTLATVLQGSGYSTVSMHAYHRGMWNRAFLHPKYGFERSLFRRELGEHPRIGWGLDDVVFFKKAAPEIARQQQPFMAFLITLSSHHPYTYIPRNKRTLKLGSLENTMVGHYLHSVRYADQAIERFFKDLDKRGLLDDTVVVLYGDHDGHLKRKPRDTKAIDALLDVPEHERRYIAKESVVLDRVPLLIRLPGGEHAGVVEAIGGQVDVTPTVLHLLGVEHDAPFVGRPLLPGATGGRAARWDGAAIGDGAVYDPRRQTCHSYPDMEPLTPADCAELKAYAAREVEMSWRVTNHDLASVLSTAAR